MKNGNQYKIQKKQDGEENNPYKNFTSRLEEVYIPNKTSYVVLSMNTMEINSFCNGHQYEMQKNRDREGNNTYKIFTSRVEEGCIPNTISYVELFLNAMKINPYYNGHQYEMKKSRGGGGNNTYKFCTSRGEEGNIPNTIPYVELFMNAMKIKDNFYDVYQYEMQKRRDGGGNNTSKTFTSRGEEGNIPNTISFVELFMTTMKMKNNFCDEY